MQVLKYDIPCKKENQYSKISIFFSFSNNRLHIVSWNQNAFFISTATSIHRTSQQAPINPSPDTNTMNAPITMKTMDRLLARSPSLHPATFTLFRAGVTSEERAFIFTNIPAIKSPKPRACNFSHKTEKLVHFVLSMTKKRNYFSKTGVQKWKKNNMYMCIYVMSKYRIVYSIFYLQFRKHKCISIDLICKTIRKDDFAESFSQKLETFNNVKFQALNLIQ